MSLRETPVRSGLNYRLSFKGLYVEDLVSVIPGLFLGVLVTEVFDASVLWFLPCVTSPVLAVAMLRRSADVDVVHNLLQSFLAPRRLDHKEVGAKLPPFPGH